MKIIQVRRPTLNLLLLDAAKIKLQNLLNNVIQIADPINPTPIIFRMMLHAYLYPTILANGYIALCMMNTNLDHCKPAVNHLISY